MNLSKLKYKGFTVFVTILFLASLILLNVFAGMLTDRFFLKADLTETGIYTISERAQEYLDAVNEPIDVIVLSEESAWLATASYSIISNILRNYSAATGGNLRVQYVDPNLNSFNGPKYNNSLSQLKDSYAELEHMTRNDIIFLSDRRASIVSAMDLFSQGQDAYGRSGIAGIRADQELISALVFVLNEEIARIVFITNHGEVPANNMEVIFERSGYNSSNINLATEEIPADTNLLVTVSPQFDFLTEEIIKLEQYMSLGGNLIVLYDPQLPELPLLDGFLADWGIVIEDKLIFDEVYTYVQQYGIIGAHVVSGRLPSTANAEILSTNVIHMGALLPRPMSLVGTGSGFEYYPLIQTFSTSSYAKDISSGSVTTTEREAGDESGPFVLAYHVSRLTRDINSNQVNANLIVAGAAKFDDTFLGLYGNSFYNPVLLGDWANDFNPFGSRIFIGGKDLSSSQMIVSSGGTRVILITMVIALPLVIIGTGVVVWRKRRHL